MGAWNVGRTLEKFCVLSTFHIGHYANKPVESAAYYWNMSSALKVHKCHLYLTHLWTVMGLEE